MAVEDFYYLLEEIRPRGHAPMVGASVLDPPGDHSAPGPSPFPGTQYVCEDGKLAASSTSRASAPVTIPVRISVSAAASLVSTGTSPSRTALSGPGSGRVGSGRCR